MRTISHWYHVDGPAQMVNGQLKRSYYSYPVYMDELSPFEEEAKRIHTEQRLLHAECLVLDTYIEVVKKRAELAKLQGSPVRAIGDGRAPDTRR